MARSRIGWNKLQRRGATGRHDLSSVLVLDTSAVSSVMHRVQESLDRLRRYRPADIVLTAPVAAEISFGLNRLAPRSRRRRLLENEYRRLREVVTWADWSEPAALEFGRQKAVLFSRGDVIDDMDIVIASIAMQLAAGVATHNAKHFAVMEGLEVDDWGPPLGRTP